MALDASEEFKAVTETIRAGDLDGGLTALEGVSAPEPFKAMIRGEVAAFRLDWDTTVEENLVVAEAAQTGQAWHWGNAFEDHFQLASYAALKCGRRAEVLELVDRLAARSEGRLDAFQRARLRAMVDIDTPLEVLARRELPTPLASGADISSLYPMLAKNQPRVPPDSVDGLSYLLSFAPRSVASDEVLALYETVAHHRGLWQEHEKMALLYLAVGDEAGAWRAVRRYARAWVPFEWSQVEPIQLFGSYALGGLITEERGRVILYRQLEPLIDAVVWPYGAVESSTASHDRDAVLGSTVVYLSYGLLEVQDAESEEFPESVFGARTTWTPTVVQLFVGGEGDAEILIVRGTVGNGVLVFDGTLELPSGVLAVRSNLDDVDFRLSMVGSRAVRIRAFIEPAVDDGPNRLEIMIDDEAPSAEGTHGAFIPRDDETFAPHMLRSKAEIAAGLDLPSSLDRG